MKEKETLIYIINEYIKYTTESLVNANIEHISLLKEKLKETLENSSLLLKVDLNKIKELLPDIDKSILSTLEFYTVIVSNSDFTLLGEDYENLNNIIKGMLEKLTKKETIERDKIVAKENELSKILEKVRSDDFDLTPDDVKKIYGILKNSGIKEDKIFLVMRFMVNEMIKPKEVKPDKVSSEDKEPFESNEEVVEIKETNLSYDELEDLFQRYDCHLSMMDINNSNLLQQFGNIENIKGIIDTFISYGMDMAKYLKIYDSQLTNIFIYSDPILVKELIKACKDYRILSAEKTASNIVDFDFILRYPSSFLKRKKKWQRRTDTGGIDVDYTSPAGRHEDFIKNLEYFSNEGLNISEAYNKNGNYLFRPHEHILDVVKTFKLYGIDKEKYLKTLSCFDLNNQADSIDMFIELGYYDYLKNNMSRCMLPPDSPTFYKLARARQLRIPPKKYGIKLESNVTYNNKEFLGVNKSNGAEVTGQYTFAFEGRDYFDKVIKENSNNSIAIVTLEQKDLIKTFDDEFLVNANREGAIYNIDGIIISRMKFLRILNTLIENNISINTNSIVYALTKNSIITKEECMMVYGRVNDMLDNKLSRGGSKRNG